MSENPAFQLLSRTEFTASGPLNDNGSLITLTCTDRCQWALFWLSDESGKSLHLGFFSSFASLQAYTDRFIAQPQTTPALSLMEDEIQSLRTTTSVSQLPTFTGVFGTAFSGYLLKEDVKEGMPEERSGKVMLFYTADYRSELLGVFSPDDALKAMTRHYDNRRMQCMLC